MKRRGHRIVRYADDILILCATRSGAEQAQAVATEILEGTLKLTVNLEQVIADLNLVLRGFANYFRMANCKSLFTDLAVWIHNMSRIRTRTYGSVRGLSRVSLPRLTLLAVPALPEFTPYGYKKRGMLSTPLFTYGVTSRWSIYSSLTSASKTGGMGAASALDWGRGASASNGKLCSAAAVPRFTKSSKASLR